MLRGILAAVGIKEPGSPLTALIRPRRVSTRALLAMGFRFRERGSPVEVDKIARSRIEALYTAVMRLRPRRRHQGGRHAGPAHDRRAPRRRSCAGVAGHQHRGYAAGERGRADRPAGTRADRDPRLAHLPRRARPTSGGAGAGGGHGERDPRGGRLYLRGRWREAKDILDTAFASWPNRRAAWHSNAQLFAAYVRFWLGDMAELGRYHARLLGESGATRRSARDGAATDRSPQHRVAGGR